MERESPDRAGETHTQWSETGFLICGPFNREDALLFPHIQSCAERAHPECAPARTSTESRLPLAESRIDVDFHWVNKYL